MSAIDSIGAIGSVSDTPSIDRLEADLSKTNGPAGQSFASILETGLGQMDEKIATANDLVRQFALDDNIPVHQVTFALEEARLSVELAMQIRERLVESYRELMNMQL